MQESIAARDLLFFPLRRIFSAACSAVPQAAQFGPGL